MSRRCIRQATEKGFSLFPFSIHFDGTHLFKCTSRKLDLSCMDGKKLQAIKFRNVNLICDENLIKWEEHISLSVFIFHDLPRYNWIYLCLYYGLVLLIMCDDKILCYGYDSTIFVVVVFFFHLPGMFYHHIKQYSMAVIQFIWNGSMLLYTHTHFPIIRVNNENFNETLNCSKSINLYYYHCYCCTCPTNRVNCV